MLRGEFWRDVSREAVAGWREPQFFVAVIFAVFATTTGSESSAGARTPAARPSASGCVTTATSTKPSAGCRDCAEIAPIVRIAEEGRLREAAPYENLPEWALRRPAREDAR